MELELFSLELLDRLTLIARRLFNEAQEPTIKMLYAAALRGLREEIKSRSTEHRAIRVVAEDHDPFEN
jgi:hypothetical protein